MRRDFVRSTCRPSVLPLDWPACLLEALPVCAWAVVRWLDSDPEQDKSTNHDAGRTDPVNGDRKLGRGTPGGCQPARGTGRQCQRYCKGGLV